MKRLLQIEWIKIRYYRTFWIFLGVYSVLLFLIFFGVGGYEFEGQNWSIPLGSLAIYDFPQIWHTLSYLASYFHWIIGILVIILVNNEVSYRTFRQNLIEGMSRLQLVGAKIFLILSLAVGITLIVFLIGLILGLIYSSQPAMKLNVLAIDYGVMFRKIDYLLGFFVQLMGHLSMAMLIGLLIQRNGLSIILYALYMLAFEPLIRYRLIEEVAQWMPGKAITGLIGNPYAGFWGGQVATSPFGMNFFLTIGYCIIFWGVGYLLLHWRDL